MFILVLIVIYAGVVVGTLVQANSISELKPVKKCALIIPFVVPAIVIACAIEDRDILYLRLLIMHYNILVISCLFAFAKAKREKNRKTHLIRDGWRNAKGIVPQCA